MTQTEKFVSLEQQYYAQVFPRHPIVLTKGHGAKVWNIEGHEYLDLTAGWGIRCLGHSHPTVVEVLIKQANRLMQASNLFYTPLQSRFAERLFRPALARLITSSLSTVEQMRWKGLSQLARQATDRTEIIPALNSSHGRTLRALSETGQPKPQAPYQPLLPGFQFVRYNQFSALEESITDRTAAIILEPIRGEGGVHVADSAYLRRVR